MRKRVRKSLFPDAAEDAGFPIVPVGDTVEQRLRSLMEHPFYQDPVDGRLRDHVRREFSRAYPGGEDRDASGRSVDSAPALRPDEVRSFDPRAPSSLEARQAARHGTGEHSTLPQMIGRAIPTDTKLDAATTGGRWLGMKLAPLVMEHYRGGSGEPLELPAEKLRAHPAIRKAESQNQEYLKQDILNTPALRDGLAALKEGESYAHPSPLTHQNKDINANDRSDLHYASGLSNLDSSATLRFTRDGDGIRIDGEHAHHWHDPYDWKKGTSFLWGLITGDEMLDLEKQGKAKPFDMHGRWGGAVSGRIPIGADGTLGAPEIDWGGGRR
jgi:hypothetical protein